MPLILFVVPLREMFSVDVLLVTTLVVSKKGQAIPICDNLTGGKRVGLS
jgi:hypothetical protein